MRSLFSALFILLVTCIAGCLPAVDKPGAARPIFRHYNTELSTIRLGELWTAEEVAGAEAGDTVVGLSLNPAERAQAVRVHRTPAGVVSSIMFDYPQATDFGAMQKEYTDLLGSPAKHDRPRGPDAAERIVWQDSVTSFELVRDPTRSASPIYTRLLDRSLTR